MNQMQTPWKATHTPAYFGKRRTIRRNLIIASAIAAIALLAPVGCTRGGLFSPADGDNRAVLRGTVTDIDGVPLAGVTVRIGRCSGAKPLNFNDFHVLTNEQGKYSITLRWIDDAHLTLASIQAALPHYVAQESTEEVRVSTGDGKTLDFQLQPGQILAGRIERPLTNMEKTAGLTAADNRYQFTVANDSFRQSAITERGGAFSLYVPPGKYTIRVLDPPLIIADVAVPAEDLLLQPEPVKATPEHLQAAFDALWENMDRNYSYFALKRIDWQALRNQYQPRIQYCRSIDTFVTLLKEMLAQLEDMHVWIDTPTGIVGAYERPWQRNWSPQAVQAALTDHTNCQDFAIVGRTRDDFGVLIITRQNAATPDSVRRTLSALATLRDAPGFIVDLRGGCTGGDESLARQLASFFCEKSVVYARSQHRTGPAHSDLSTPTDRTLESSDKPYTRPVVCLIGSKCMSSGEGLVQMMSALPHVTTIGMRTRGASGNPKPFTLPELPIQVWYSRWVDLMPDGTPVEGRGIAPDVIVDEPVSAYGGNDPTWQQAVSLLQRRCATATSSSAEAAPRVAAYELNAQFDPPSPDIRAEAHITFAPPENTTRAEDLTFYLHDELNVEKIKLDGHPVDFTADVVPYAYNYTTKALRVRIPHTNASPPRTMTVSYAGVFNPSTVRSRSDYMRIDADGVLLRCYGYSLWFPIFLPARSQDYRVDFPSVTIDTPAAYQPVFIGQRTAEDCVQDRRRSRWKAENVRLVDVQLTARRFDVLNHDDVYVYCLQDTASRDIGTRVLEFTASLNAACKRHFNARRAFDQIHIMQTPKYADISSFNVTGLADARWHSFVEGDSGQLVLAHEFVHPFVQIDVSRDDPLYALMVEGVPSYFHLLILAELKGEPWYQCFMDDVREAYLQRRADVAENSATRLPREKALYEIGPDEIGRYKDHFVLADRALLFFDHLRSRAGKEAFGRFTRELCANDTLSHTDFEALIRRQIDIGSDELELWLRTSRYDSAMPR